MRRILLALFAWLFATSLALAGTTTIQITVGSGTTYRASTDGSANLFGNYGLCDFTACAAGLAITTTSPTSAQGAAVVDIGPNSATLPVSIGGTVTVTGTVTANAGTNLNTSLLALESGGNLATLAGSITSAVSQANIKQVNGATTLAGSGAVGTGSIRVAVGTDTATIAGSAPGTAGTPSANVLSVQGASGGTNLPVSVASPTGAAFAFTSNDPCSQALKTNVTINIATSTQLITGASGKKTYICAAFGIAGAALSFDIQEGTGTLCATSPSYLVGGPVASVSVAANGGFTYGSGAGTVIPAIASPLDNVCLIETSAVGIGGNISYVQQ